jgi:hypothetical protein
VLKNGVQTEWISIALNNWSLLDNNSDENIENNTDVFVAWVKDQQKYYCKTKMKLQHKRNKIVATAKTFFIASFIIAVIFLVDTFIGKIIPESLKYVMYACNGIFVGIGSFIMAMLMFFLEKKGFEGCGIVFVEDGSERIAYHKIINT